MNRKSVRLGGLWPSPLKRHGLALATVVAFTLIAPGALAFSRDSFEDDNAPTSATAYAVQSFNNIQNHNLHTTTDQDWIKFFWVTTEDYNVTVTQKGTNIDSKIEIWRESFGGGITKVLTEDSSELGNGTSESLTLNIQEYPFLGNGYYYLRVYDKRFSPGVNKTGSPKGAGGGPIPTGEDSETDYDAEISVADGGAFIVAAVDLLNSGFSPSNSVAIIDGVSTQAFVNGAVTTVFNLPSPGVHTVLVTTASGYFGDHDPTTPGEINNPESVLYGNPRQFTMDSSWEIVVFVFAELLRVEGQAIDAGNGNAGLANVSLSFEAQTGVINTNVFDRYPQGATYSVAWETDSNGNFPTNVWLPLADYDVTLEHPTLGTQTVSSIIRNAAGGAVTNIGVFTFDSGGSGGVDTDTDDLDDSWETNWFGNLNQVGIGDPDEDGLSNELEETRNSDPTRRVAPGWWSTRSVFDTTRLTNDYVLINQGQLKWLAKQAALEMDAQFSDGSGTAVSNLVDSFTTTNNFQAVNMGQLKYVAEIYYNRLIAVTNADLYPWGTATSTNDDAASNLGQAKHLFSFDIQP